MDSSLQVVPLAITMMAGPQIMSAIIFVTGTKAIPTSVGFVIGITLGATLGVLAMMGVASLLGSQLDLGDSSDSGSTGKVIQYALVGLLILASLKSFLGRETSEPPQWLGKLQEMSPAGAFKTGALLITFFPSDFVVLLTVGMNLEQSGASFTEALPFIGLTVLIAALPLLSYLLFRRRAEVAMPKVRDWMNANSWLVNIIVYAIFIVLIL
jgi:hypothetical protein